MCIAIFQSILYAKDCQISYCYRSLSIVEESLAKRHTKNLPSPSLKTEIADASKSSKGTTPHEPDLPDALKWTCFRVCNWVRELGYPNYVVRSLLIAHQS